MPTQMPSTGRRNERMTGTSPRSVSERIASAALPTPGRMTLSADRITSGSAVRQYEQPSRESAFSTERMFPA